MLTTKVLKVNGTVTNHWLEEETKKHQEIHEEIQIVLEAYRKAFEDGAKDEVIGELHTVLDEAYNDFLDSSNQMIEYLKNPPYRKATMFPASFVKECAKYEVNL